MISGLLNSPGLPAPAYFNAAKLLQRAGCLAEMDQALQMCMARVPSNINPGVFIEIAKIYAGVNQHQRYGEVLEKYLERDPGNWQIWLNLASLHLGMKQTNAAVKALGQALRVGGVEAQMEMERNPQFEPLRQLASTRAQGLFGMPEAMGAP
jgi:predicted Zn-dependent protease